MYRHITADFLCLSSAVAIAEAIFIKIKNVIGRNEIFSLCQFYVISNFEADFKGIQLPLAGRRRL